ncbi:hypothetical protein [Heyndrickxia ginsengihumi]|uniref:hypothetical protein n=1 Tax=Heyndrickxia ginsengihumi TaxID=363870 RepID=UPI0004AF25BB|nr:hypothetical protein [Heyndrickxia ginsengihumi]
MSDKYIEYLLLYHANLCLKLRSSEGYGYGLTNKIGEIESILDEWFMREDKKKNMTCGEIAKMYEKN